MDRSRYLDEFTDAPVRLQGIIAFEGRSGEDVFDIMGDPDRITDWYLLAKTVHHHAPGPDGEARFNVEFTFFGHVFEEVLLWEAPDRYVYRATGPDFPIKDYVAEISVEMTGERAGRMTWSMFFNSIEGQEFRRILPLVLPVINEASLRKLAPLLGGELVSCVHDFSGLEATAP